MLAATTIGIYRDYHKKYVSLVYGSKENFENKEKKTAEWSTELTKLNALLEGKEYFCGQITWVDFVVAENMQAVGLLDSKILEPFPNIVSHQKRIWELPEIKKYHDSERWQERPVNYLPDAVWA